METLTQMKCVACRKDAPTVTDAEIAEFHRQVSDWDIVELDGINRLRRAFSVDDFAQALEFTNKVGELAEDEGHHPALLTEWGRTTVTWWTHKIKGQHRNDFIMAAKRTSCISHELIRCHERVPSIVCYARSVRGCRCAQPRGECALPLGGCGSEALLVGAAGGVAGAATMSAGARYVPRSTIRYSSRIGRPSNQHSRISRTGGIAGLRGQRRPRHVASSRGGASTARDDPGSRLRNQSLRHTRQAGRFPAPARSHRGRRSSWAVLTMYAPRFILAIRASSNRSQDGGRVDRDHVADTHHRLGVRVVGHAELALDLLRKSVSIGVVQSHLKRLQPPEYSRTDPTGSDRPDLHPFEVVRPGDAVGDVPAALDDPLIRGDVVADQRQDHHHHMLGHADAVGIGDLGDGDPTRSPLPDQRGPSRSPP